MQRCIHAYMHTCIHTDVRAHIGTRPYISLQTSCGLAAAPKPSCNNTLIHICMHIIRIHTKTYIWQQSSCGPAAAPKPSCHNTLIHIWISYIDSHMYRQHTHTHTYIYTRTYIWLQSSCGPAAAPEPSCHNTLIHICMGIIHIHTRTYIWLQSSCGPAAAPEPSCSPQYTHPVHLIAAMPRLCCCRMYRSWAPAVCMFVCIYVCVSMVYVCAYVYNTKCTHIHSSSAPNLSHAAALLL